MSSKDEPLVVCEVPENVEEFSTSEQEAVDNDGSTQDKKDESVEAELNKAAEDEVANINQNQPSIEETMKQCAGVLGDLERRTCANPNATLEEIEFKKKGDGSRLRIRPRSPLAVKPRRNRRGERLIMKNGDPKFMKKAKKLTKTLSPVCGDDTLAIFLMKGYSYESPMARNTTVPIYESEDEISDSELEPNVCESCLFCQRDGVRHHRDKKDEIKLIRRVRSPCRCFHTCIQEDEENGKNFIMERFLRQKLDDFSPEVIDEAVPERVKRTRSPSPAEPVVEKLPRIATPEDIDQTRSEIKDKSSTGTTELEVVDIQSSLPTRPKEEPNIEIVEVATAPIARQEVGEPQVVKVESQPRAALPKSSCHITHVQKVFRPQRVSVIQPTRSHTSGASSSRMSSEVTHPRPGSMISATSSSGQFRVRPYHSGNETVTVKVENQSDDPYRARSYPHGTSSYRQLGSQGASMSSQFSSLGSQPTSDMFIKHPYSGSCHSRPQIARISAPVQHFQPVQPHNQSVYSQEDLNRRMLQPGHPPRIRACIERLAAKLTVSRHVAERNENQVVELLKLACEVRREEDCDTFYCTWQDCVKHFNRRDSLVRHLRVHVNVRPFKCERCGTLFLRSDHLRVHMLRHTGEQPFACIVCGVTFSRKDMRNRHMKTTHYRDTVPPQNVLDLLEGESWDAIEVDASDGGAKGTH